MYPTQPTHNIITGSETKNAYKLKNSNKYVYEKNIKSLKFIQVFNVIKKDLPILINTKWTGHRFNIDFKDVFYIDKPFFKEGQEIVRLDIKKAYKSILMPFFSEKTLEYINKQNKTDFLKAVGFSAFHKQFLNLETGNIDKEERGTRPDILNTCVDFLKTLRDILKDYGLVWQYVDCFSFRKMESKKIYQEAFKLIFDNWIQQNDLKKYQKREVFFDFHLEKNEIITITTINQKFQQTTKIELINKKTSEIKTYFL